MDFIAEILLRYCDKELSGKLNDIRYKIIRYRDDYRIFTNSIEDGKTIMKELSSILSDVGLRLNSAKTISSDDIITSSIKPDKLYWLINKNENKNRILSKELLMIKQLLKDYPNSSALQKDLTDFCKRLKSINKSSSDKRTKSKSGNLTKETLIFKKLSAKYKPLSSLKSKLESIFHKMAYFAKNYFRFKKVRQITNHEVLIALTTDIAFRNPRSFHICIGILGEILFSMNGTDDKTKEAKQKYISKIQNKFKKLPNAEFLDIWLQRLTIKNSNKNCHIYQSQLCKRAYFDYHKSLDEISTINTHEAPEIWNSKWIQKGNLKNIMLQACIIDKQKIEKIDANRLSFDEIDIFDDYS